METENHEMVLWRKRWKELVSIGGNYRLNAKGEAMAWEEQIDRSTAARKALLSEIAQRPIESFKDLSDEEHFAVEFLLQNYHRELAEYTAQHYEELVPKSRREWGPQAPDPRDRRPEDLR